MYISHLLGAQNHLNGLIDNFSVRYYPSEIQQTTGLVLITGAELALFGWKYQYEVMNGNTEGLQ